MFVERTKSPLNAYTFTNTSPPNMVAHTEFDVMRCVISTAHGNLVGFLLKTDGRERRKGRTK